MTLKQLLRQSDREQVDFNLAPAPIAGRELRAGQYSVAVQRVPDASQTTLGKLANALGQVSPLIAKYGEMQISATDLQNQEVDNTLAGMTPEDREKLMRSTEEQIVKKLGGNYELNSVATIRAKKLIGAEYTNNFVPYLEEKLAEFSALRVKENGDKPSPLEVNNEINRLTGAYIEQNPQLNENQLMQAGFFEQANAYINKKKINLPGQLAEQHKTETLMPNIVNSLVRFANDDDKDPAELAAFWEGNTRFLSPSEQKKILDDTAAVLNFDGSEENLDAGIAFYESMRLAGIQIGNQPIDADDPKADNEYTRRIQDLKDIREKVQAEDFEKHRMRVATFVREQTTEFAALEKVGHPDDSEEVFSLRDKLYKEIEENPETTATQKRDYKASVDKAIVNGFSRRTGEIDTLTRKYAQTKPSLTPTAVSASVKRGAIGVIEKAFGDTFVAEDYEDLVEVTLRDGGPLAQVQGTQYDIVQIRSGLLTIVNNADTRYAELHGETMEEVSALERAGDTVELGGKTYEIREGKDVEREKLRIASEYLLSQHDSMMDQVEKDIDEVVNNSKKRAEEERTVQEKQQAEQQAELDKLDLGEKALKGLTADSYTVVRDGLEIPVYTGELRGDFVEKRYDDGLPLSPIITQYNMPKLIEGTNLALKAGAHRPGELVQIGRQIKKIHKDAIPVYQERSRELNRRLKKASGPGMSRLKAVEVEKEITQLKYEVFNNRRIAGLSAADAKTLLRTNYLPEGARVGIPMEFLKGELTGLDPDSESSQPYKSSMLIEGTDEELKDISDTLNLDFERLKAAQGAYKNYLDGVVPQKAEQEVEKEGEPEVKPEVAKSDPAQLELDLTASSAPTPPVTSATEEEFKGKSDFLIGIKNAESFHGGTPQPTKDAREKNVPMAKKSKDIGYGHKLTSRESETGEIHGIRFRDDQGNLIPITKEQAETILAKDLKYHTSLARKKWDTKLAELGTSWEELDAPYRDVLSSLAFNVGGAKAGKQWKDVLVAAKNKDVRLFAKEIRRKDNKRNTRGMDNRAAKELYAAGLIKDLSEVKESLPLADQFK